MTPTINTFFHLIAVISNRYKVTSRMRHFTRWQLILRLSNLRLKERDTEKPIRQIERKLEPYLYTTKFLLTKLRLLA